MAEVALYLSWIFYGIILVCVGSIIYYLPKMFRMLSEIKDLLKK